MPKDYVVKDSGEPNSESVRQPTNEQKWASRNRFYAAQARVKKSLGCSACGYNENPDALEWDHVRPLLIAGQRPRAVRVGSMIALQKAMADHNVQLLCGNCHNIKTVREKRRHV